MIVALQTLVFFRNSILNTLERFVRPYFLNLLPFVKAESGSDDEEAEEVFAEYDDEKGVVFFPPLYLQRYAAVFDCLMDERWRRKLEKVVDFGYNNMAFIKYLKDLAGVQYILGVDLEGIPLQSHSWFFKNDLTNLDSLLQIVLYQGNAADPDYRLIGCDAVVSIEMIEHMLPHDLERLIHTVFGFIKPRIAVFTTPNGDFNVLFKSLESNGLRRLDHFFEWSREQFYDWCSNIVLRYPGYTVSCKGIGPGPAGTQHLGCCSQLALFVAKDYHKQEELNLNCLAYAEKTSDPNISMAIDWDNHITTSENNMICAPDPENSLLTSEESLTGTSALQNSSMSVVLSPKFSLESMQFEDKIAQCNMDKEVGKGFVMFNDEEMYSVVVPRRQNENRVYEIEDITRRLNCTSLQVTKFSPTTKNLMSKHITDSMRYNNETIEEIRELTKMLNLNQKNMKQIQNGGHTWCNINWGDNAPYWNQYYKLVKEYSYPFENKSEDARIFDAISEEINHLIDTPNIAAKFTKNGTKLEIPIEYLMTVVQHITTDVDKVKDLLEWNGYEIYDDVLIHSLLMIENVTESHEEDWQDNESSIESDATEIRSNTPSDGSDIIRRALVKKVQKLCSIAEVDVTIELERVFSQLLNATLRRSRNNTPIPAKWLQYKLLDLLNLTEKAIERRKLRIVDRCTLKCIEDQHRAICDDIQTLNSFKEECTGDKLVNKYRHLVEPPCDNITENILFDDYIAEVEESLADLSSGPPFVEEFNAKESNHVIQSRTIEYGPHIAVDKIERIEAWMDEDLKLAECEKYSDVTNSGDTDNNESIQPNIKETYKTRDTGNLTNQFYDIFSDTPLKKGRHGNPKHKRKTSFTKIGKKLGLKKSCICSYTKTITNDLFHEYSSVIIKSSTSIKYHQSCPNPIPKSILHLHCSSIEKITKLESQPRVIELHNKEVKKPVSNINISATENVDVLNIVTDEREETIVLRRAIGTDTQPVFEEEDALIEKVISVINDETNEVPQCNQENVEDDQSSLAIFLIDINEPTTSKGIRHINMDAQCGPDANFPQFSKMSTSTSFSRIPSMFTAVVKSENSMTYLKCNKEFIDFGTSTSYDNKLIAPTCRKFNGITIKDSLPNIHNKVEGSANTETDVLNKINVAFMDNIKFTNNVTDKIVCSRNFNKKQHTTTNFLTLKESHHKTFTIDTQAENNNDVINSEKPSPENNQHLGNAEIHEKTRNNVVFSPTETILRPVASDMKIDSGSDFNVSISSSTISCLKFAKPLKKSSYCKIKPSISKDVAVKFTKLTKYVRPKLSYGGTHVHSYKERQESNDIMYLGKWDIQSPRAVAKKINKDVPATKKDSVMRKRRVPSSIVKGNGTCEKKSNVEKKLANTTVSKTLEPMKNYLPLYLRKNLSTQLKKDKHGINVKSGENKHHVVNLKKGLLVTSKAEDIKNKKILHYRQHVLNKSLDSAKTAKNNKEKTIDKTSPFVRLNTEEIKKEKVVKFCKFVVSKNAKSKILKIENILSSHKRQAVGKDILNKSFGSAKKKENKEQTNKDKNQNKLLPVAKLKTEETKNSLLNYKEKRHNVNVFNKVLVYLNDGNSKKSPNISPRRSLNSSRIPSPTSIASIQAITTKSKHMTSCKRQTTSSLEKQSIEKDVLHKSFDSANKKVKREKQNKILPLAKLKAEETYNSLLNNKDKRNNFNVVNNACAHRNDINSKNTPIKSPRRFSPNSNVIIHPITIKSNDIPSYKRQTTSSQNENVAKLIAKSIKNIKSYKKESCAKTNINYRENKLLAPISNFACINSNMNNKISFEGQHMNVFMAQLNTSRSLLKLNGGSFKNKSQIHCTSNIKSTVAGCTDDKITLINSVVNESSIKSEISYSNDCTKNVLTDHILQSEVESKENKKILDNQTNHNLIVNDSLATIEPSVYISKSTDDMKNIIEDSLEFIDCISNDKNVMFDTATVILRHDDIDNCENASPTSYKTVLTNDDFLEDSIEKELEDALNSSFEFATTSDYFMDSQNFPSTNKLDSHSFRSIASSSLSKMTEYFNAGNELEKTTEHKPVNPNTVSLRDIFERKDNNTVQIPVGALASQAFSGFSVEAAPGDQPDYFNILDLETGNLEVNRQVASEEVLVSGRSTSSFATCQVDEDAVVPNWLFNIINQQQSEQEDAIPDLPEPLPPTEPVFDDNGNVVDGMAGGSGAGDGQGVHSDQSQDSSGRGSSISSSVTSTESHDTDTLLIDPLSGQFETLQADSSRIFTTLPEVTVSPNSSSTSAPENVSLNVRRAEVQRPTIPPQVLVSSDGDADVSSLEADVCSLDNGIHDSDN